MFINDYRFCILSGRLVVEVSVCVLLLLTALSPVVFGSEVGCGVSQAAIANKPITPNAKRIFFINDSLGVTQ